MEQTITLDQALALAYFKEGFPYGEDYTVLFEAVSNGGDLEFFTFVLEQVIPVVEAHLEQYELDAPDRLYLFYGDVFPAQLHALLKVASTPTEQQLTQCIEQSLDSIASEMCDIRMRTR
ncbi:hypothetical protein [Vibrio sp. TBV020]|uniref:hypothetical protein n=1 Tax=Vibrio sp. TBV020 TaxID=3137398 RepID=UPI0038CD1EB4